jgi:DNA-binding Lrp family transcriptional regulator
MLDATDSRLLAALQDNAMLTANELSDLLHLSPSQAARRRQRLEAAGYITRYRAELDPVKLGLGVEAFIRVVMATHTEQNARDFLRMTRAQPEITGAWTLTGEADYLLRVFCTDLAALNRLVMERVKPDAALPV